MVRIAALALCLTSLALGCERQQPTAVGPAVISVTNVVEVTREIVVTNTVTRELTVTNTVIVRKAEERVLSGRKTAPYRVSAAGLDDVTLRKLVSESGARAIDCANGAVALVEASDGAVKTLRGVVEVEAVSGEGKLATDAGEAVRIVPLSSIDAAAITRAVRELGGEIVQVVTVGSPAVRAKLSYSSIRKLAERGDVRRIERDGK